MSRFKQPERTLAPLPAAQLGKPEAKLGQASAVADQPRAASPASPSQPVPAGGQNRPSPFARVQQPLRQVAESRSGRAGLFALCGFIVSPYLQDLTMHAGFKPYLNYLFEAMLLLMFVPSGRMLRGLHSKVGWAWVGFVIFAGLSVPFSYWRGESLTLLFNFLWRALSVYFLMCTFAVTYKQVQQVMYANVAAAILVLIGAIAFSDYNQGMRLQVADSYLLANANDLALHLLLDLGFFSYLMMKRDNLVRIFGGSGALISLYFILKSGSRGGVVALGVFLLASFVFSRSKIVWAVAAVPALVVALAVTPSNTLHRFTMILLNPDVTQAHSQEDVGAIESQQERQDMMRRALHFIAARPLIGVGPGEFTDAVWADEHRDGKHPPALGTHNTYLEVASECGLPAFFCYMGVLFSCIIVNYRSFTRFRQQSDHADMANMAYCMLAMSLGFSVNLFFHHLTYAVYLPLLSGMTFCIAHSLPSDARANA